MSLYVSRVLAVLMMGVAIPSYGFAAEQNNPESFKWSGDMRVQGVYEDDLDLNTGTFDDHDLLNFDARLRGTWKALPNITVFGEGRAFHSTSDGSSTDDEDSGTSSSLSDFLELRQFWVRGDSFLGVPNLSLQVGRQRISEPYNFWWNRDLDLARLNFDFSLTKGFVAAGQDMWGYRTGESTFDNEDEDRFRVLVQSVTEWRPEHFVEGRFLLEDDHSGKQGVGTSVLTQDVDSDDNSLFWGGVRARGTVGKDDILAYRVDLAGVTGSVDHTNTSAGAVSGTRTINSHSDIDVRAWALDADVQWKAPVWGAPVLMAGYAFGSGDSDSSDSTDHSFRQSSIQGNSSRFMGMNGTRRNYGEVLDPDLSNLHIFTAGITYPLFTSSDVGMAYHYYRLADADGSLRGQRVDASLDGNESSLGHGLDLTGNFKLGKELGVTSYPLESTSLKATVGAFKAGDAYVAAGEDEKAMRGFIEMKVNF